MDGIDLFLHRAEAASGPARVREHSCVRVCVEIIIIVNDDSNDGDDDDGNNKRIKISFIKLMLFQLSIRNRSKNLFIRPCTSTSITTAATAARIQTIIMIVVAVVVVVVVGASVGCSFMQSHSGPFLRLNAVTRILNADLVIDERKGSQQHQ